MLKFVFNREENQGHWRLHDHLFEVIVNQRVLERVEAQINAAFDIETGFARFMDLHFLRTLRTF